MNPRLITQLSEFQSSWEVLMEKLEAYPPHYLNKQPAADKWSVVQIMQHLTAAEEGSARYMQYKLKNNAVLKKAGLKAWYRFCLLKIANALPLKFKAPVALVPPENSLSFSDAKTEWGITRNALLSVIESMNPDQIKGELFKHPIVGRLNMSQALQFMQEHFNRHEKQIFKVLETVK